MAPAERGPEVQRFKVSWGIWKGYTASDNIHTLNYDGIHEPHAFVTRESDARPSLAGELGRHLMTNMHTHDAATDVLLRAAAGDGTANYDGIETHQLLYTTQVGATFQPSLRRRARALFHT